MCTHESHISLKEDCHGQGKLWKMKLCFGQGKVGEFCAWPGKFRKDLKNQELENQWLWQSLENALLLLRGKGCSF